MLRFLRGADVGFEDSEASWEPLERLFKDEPHLVQAYIEAIPPTAKDKQTWKALLLELST